MASVSSSSDFSSDDDDDSFALDAGYEAQAQTSHAVEIEVVADEDEMQDDEDPTELVDSLRDAGVPDQLVQAAASVLAPSDPAVLYRYDAFTTALYYFSSLWPEDSGSQRPLHRARAAIYRRFQSAFPLTPAMYSEFISDVETITQKHRLYEKAMGDYWSVELALHHIDLLDENRDSMPGALEALMERLLDSVGHHYTQGHDVWVRCRELTAELYAEASDLEKEAAIRRLYQRQLTLPLQQNDLVMAEFRAWSQYNTLAGEAGKRAFQTAEYQHQQVFGAAMFKQLNQWETKLADESAWLQYITVVKKHLVPSLTSEDGHKYLVCLMERAVAAVCLSSALWSDYAKLCAPNTAELLAVCRRATRNASFDSTLWTDWLVAVESDGGDASAVMESEVLARVSPPLMDSVHTARVLTTYCGVLRRRGGTQAVASMIESFRSFLAQAFPTDASALAAVLTTYAEFLAYDCVATKSHSLRNEWRDLWVEIVEIREGQAEVWMAFYDAYKFVYAGDSKLAELLRIEVLAPALNQVTDYPAVILHKWLQLDLATADLATYVLTKREYDAAVEKQQQDAMKAAASEAVTAPEASQPPPPTATSKKRKNDSEIAAKTEPKRAKTAPKGEKTERFSNDHTLFVCNVSKEASVDDLRAVFSHISTLVDVRLVVKERGHQVKSRSMAYVQFSDDSGVVAGLELDGAELRGQAIKVTRSEPPGGATKATAKANSRAPPAKATSTLYVHGLLPADRDPITESEVETALAEVLGGVDAIKRVMILNDKRGRQKDHGLVELSNSKLVSTAVAKQSEVQQRLGEQVTVQASKMTIDQVVRHRGEQKQATAAAKQEKTKPTKQTMPVAIARPPVAKPASLMPRALRKKIVATAVEETREQKSEVAEPVKPKSNADFRRLFM